MLEIPGVTWIVTHWLVANQARWAEARQSSDLQLVGANYVKLVVLTDFRWRSRKWMDFAWRSILFSLHANLTRRMMPRIQDRRRGVTEVVGLQNGRLEEPFWFTFNKKWNWRNYSKMWIDLKRLIAKKSLVFQYGDKSLLNIWKQRYVRYESVEIFGWCADKQAIDEFQINEINVDLRTSGFDNEVLSVDACAVWWERESFCCLPRIGVVTWHREPRFQCGSARTGSIWNSSIAYKLTDRAWRSRISYDGHTLVDERRPYVYFFQMML